MSMRTSEKGYSLLQSELIIPGAIIKMPPPPEERVFYVAPEADAYTPSANAQGRTTAEIIQACLSDTDKSLILPEIESQNIFRLRRQLGGHICNYVVGTLENPTSTYMASCQAVGMIPHIQSPEKRREVALSVLKNEIVDDYTKLIAQRAIPELHDEVAFKPAYRESTQHELKMIAQAGNRDRAKVSLVIPFYSSAKDLYTKLNPRSMTQSPLHDQAAKNNIKRFRKTGTETYILPKDQEASVRVLSIQATTTWLKAFENYTEWYQRGFNYVPIEPIQDIAPTDDLRMVAVTTTNLPGKPIRDMTRYMPHYEDQLMEMREQIRSGLSDMHIYHGHLHDGNFVAVPYVSDSGKPDMSRCPRLYAIDFDRAETIT